jgi:hypothetical protein
MPLHRPLQRPARGLRGGPAGDGGGRIARFVPDIEVKTGLVVEVNLAKFSSDDEMIVKIRDC